jgi:uncharacterized protein (DUF1697 family)
VALVVLLRGVNVGGHRIFRPTELARQLRHLDAVNVGAAGTLVIRRPVSRTQLREEVARRLPFDAGIAVCDGRDILRLLDRDFFAGQTLEPDVVRFVSLLTGTPRSAPRLPLTIPHRERWLLKVLARDGRFVVGLYRRHMKAIGCLGSLDRRFGVPATTRSWHTLVAIAKVLDEAGARLPRPASDRRNTP